MGHLRIFVFTDSNDNRIEILAPSKSKAKEMVGRVRVGGGSFHYEGEREETRTEFLQRLGRERKRAAEERERVAAQPRLVKRRKAFGRNDRCPCGSGKKVKHCRCSKG